MDDLVVALDAIVKVVCTPGALVCAIKVVVESRLEV